MGSLTYVLVTTLKYFLTAMQVLLIVDVILSWLPLEDDSPIVQIVSLLTAPILLPIRAILDRIGLFQSLPIDLSNMFGIIILSIIEMYLTV